MKIPCQPKEALNKIVKGLVDGKIFSDRHLQAQDNMRTVFMPVALGAFQDWKEEELQEIGMIYEWLDQAGPRAINGCPNFMSFQMINKADLAYVLEKARQLDSLERKAAEEVFGETEPTSEA